ncbi:MAG TPA: MarR family transcriptional regulator [Gaiellaceae bacterium]|nr:MarR family transcriptional regulator [Gaiellaceae bacterium]
MTDAHELRLVLGRLVRRLRAEAILPLNQTTVLARLERDGELSTSALADRERMRPQSMAQTVKDLESAGLVSRHGDPSDARRMLVSLTTAGRKALGADRERREDWLSRAIETELTAREQETLARSVELLRRLAGE